MSGLVERLRGVWPAELPAITQTERHAVIELQALKKEAASEIERLRLIESAARNLIADGDHDSICDAHEALIESCK